MTTTFSTFSLHLDLLPPHNAYSPRTRSVYLAFTNITLFLHLPSLFLRLKDESTIWPISLWASKTTFSVTYVWMSDDESALAFHDSIVDPRRAAMILKRNGFSLTSPVDDGSPPNLNHSNSLLFHSPIRSAKPGARREEAPTKLTQHHLFLGSPSRLNLFPCHDFLLFPTPSLLLLPRLLLSLLLPLPCHTLSHGPLLRSCITAERVRDDQSSVFPLLGRGRFQRALARRGFVDGHREEFRSCLSDMLFIDDLSHNA